MDAIAVQTLDVALRRVAAAHAAAAPWEGRNALDAAVLGYMDVAALRQHIRPDERVHGDLHRGRRQAQHRAPSARRWSGTCARPRSATPAAAEGAGARLPRGGRAALRVHDDPRVGRTSPTPTCSTTARWSPSYVANAAALGRHGRRPGGGRTPRRRFHRHGQRQLPGAVDPPDDPGRRRPACRSTPPDFAEWARGPEGDRAVLDGAKAMAMTVVDLWCDRRRLRTAAEDAVRRPPTPTRCSTCSRRPAADATGAGGPAVAMTLRDGVRPRGVHASRKPTSSGGTSPTSTARSSRSSTCPRSSRVRCSPGTAAARRACAGCSSTSSSAISTSPATRRVDATVGLAPGRGAVREGVLRVRRRLRGPARRRAPGLRAGLEPAHQGARVGSADELPRAEHALHRLRRPARRPVPLPP